ncbi:hypothetical protein DUNSADRAFT_1691 [Dunaliella salina]|uniref:Uncharacterized protein n=1 Tax=Dunaliella salina TaxID=3046 RepID=A0ABQ7GWT5_DUNSA|nr:hypothetical protein DUNSADRAFT_1691 [Dunaliella salina]|eukprot:KAF5839074.1 hypothetical protein DUNSADRAFT_1691 [Dunaliella salina]
MAALQAAGHMSSSAVELEVLRARCKELESENCSLQHRLVDAHASRSSIAMERDIFKRMTADVRAQWQHAASVSGSPALGTSPGNSGHLILLPESTAILHSQPLPSLHLSQVCVCVQGPRSDPQLQQQLEQLRGEAAAMRQEMAAALPFAARLEGIPNTQMAGCPASDTTSPALAVAPLSPTSSSPVGSPPNCAAAANPPTSLFSSRRHLSLLNLGSTNAGLGGNSGGAGGPGGGRMGRNQMGLRGRSISALQPSTGGLSNPGTPPPASPAPGRAVMGGPEAPPQGATGSSDIGAGAPGQNHAADAAAVTVASRALSLSLPVKRYSSMPNLVRLVEEPGEGSHADGDSGDGNAHLHTTISSSRDGPPDGTLAVQAHQTSSHTAPGPALPSAPHVTPRFRARTSSSVPNELGTGHGSTATTSVPHSISAKSTPDVAGTISGTATRSQDSSIRKVARVPSNEEGAGVASRESSWGAWPPSSGPLGVADFKAVSAVGEDHPRFPGQAPGMAGLRSESVGSAGLEAGAGTLGSATGQSSRSMTCAGGAGGARGTGIGSSGVLPDACGSNSNSGSLPKAPMAMALGGRSERYMPAAGARNGVAGLGASSTGTATHTRSRSPLARGTSISQLPTGLGKSASVQEQASHSADPAADSPVHKLKQLFKQRKSNKGGLSRANTAGNF